MGNGCGSVGIAVASVTRGPRFESSRWQTLYNLFTFNCIEKTKRKKRGWDWPNYLKTTNNYNFSCTTSVRSNKE